MAQLIVRNIDDDLVRRLKQRAAASGRSAEAEHRSLLEQALRPSADEFIREAARLRAATAGRKRSDSVTLLRADRRKRGR